MNEQAEEVHYEDYKLRGVTAPNTIEFRKDDKVIGTLYMDTPMRFEGDVDESAKTFFEAIITKADKHI